MKLDYYSYLLTDIIQLLSWSNGQKSMNLEVPTVGPSIGVEKGRIHYKGGHGRGCR